MKFEFQEQKVYVTEYMKTKRKYAYLKNSILELSTHNKHAKQCNRCKCG